MKPRPVVFLVDDEPDLRKALGRLLHAEGYLVTAFDSADEFLRAQLPVGSSCLILDVSLPGLDGLELQQHLARAGTPLPIVFLTGHGDIPMSVRAIKAGATDFLTKPVDAADLLRAVRIALQQSAETADLQARLAELTPREREVLAHVLTGRLNKQIASELGIGEHTIKVHRGRVMTKLGVHSVADLIRVAGKLGVSAAT